MYAELLKEGTDLSIIAIGKMVPKAMKIASNIEKDGINAEVINVRFLKPLDKEMIKDSVNKTKMVVTIEDGTNINGLGTAINEIIIQEELEGIFIKNYAYPDQFIEHGTVEELEKIYGLDEEKIEKEIRKEFVESRKIKK